VRSDAAASASKGESAAKGETVKGEPKPKTPGRDVPSGYSKRFPAPKPARRAGVLLHPTSLPSPYGVGELGPAAYNFVDWLADAGMQVWQVLPIVPPGRPVPGVREDYWSPYSSNDARSGSVLMVSLDKLVDDGLLKEEELPPTVPVANADFQAVADVKEPLLKLAAERLLAGEGTGEDLRPQLATFCYDSASWLNDSALFATIDASEEHYGKNWWEWPAELRGRDTKALEAWREEKAGAIDEYCALQFLFDRQWKELKKYANEADVVILGDMPIYVGSHSADVWANPTLFAIEEDGTSLAVSGTPPDAFSETGQLWGSPLYDWEAHKAEGFKWWAGRMKRALELHDEIRIDHFRGLAGYWAVPGDAPTALSGSWKLGPGKEFFDGLKKHLGEFKIVAEDLGVITEDVVALREAIDAPGMVVLQFAWGGDGNNPHLPHNHYENCVCYPATHDNETTVGWFKETTAADREKFLAYTGLQDAKADEAVAWEMTRLALSSVANTTILCMQDLLSLDNTGRMNTPGVAEGNWAWRLGPVDIFSQLDAQTLKLAKLLHLYNRLPANFDMDFFEDGEKDPPQKK